MIYPKFIKKNSSIVFVAPSFGCTIEPYKTRLESSFDVLQKKGFNVSYGPNAFKSTIGRSNTPEKCAEEINYYFNDKNTDTLISVGGGELMCEILPFIDFSCIKENPKWFMGFSDNTNLTFLITTICDVASIYGPCAPSFGITPWHQSTKDALDILTGENLQITGYGRWEKESSKSVENPLAQLSLTEDTILTCYPNDNLNFSGRLLGGCLDILTIFLGTKFDHVKEFTEKYKDDGIIWFLEGCDLNPMALRRTMFQLDQANWFKYTKGFIFGRPLSAMEDLMELNRFEAIMEIIKKYNVPIIFDADLGHLPPSMPLITGSLANVKTIKNNDKLNIQIEMKLK